MFEFFDFLSNLISTIVNFVSGIIDSVVQAFHMIASGTVFLAASLGSLPPFCKGAFEVIIALCVCSVLLSSLLDFK